MNFLKNKTTIKLEMIKLERSLLYQIFTVRLRIMKKKTIAIIQCILYLIAPYIALQLCSINRSLVGEFFIIFLILLTISFWFSIWKLEKALDNDSQ